MPFGLTNALATFQGYINKILAEKLDVFVIVYLDDILIYTKSEGEKHVQAVRWVLNQLRKHSLYANLKKCRFHQNEVRFLGYIVSHQGIQMEEERIKTVRDRPETQSVYDIQVFLGFADFYRQFIQGFNRLAAPLTSMLKTTSVVGLVENPEQGGQGIQVEDRGEKELAQKSRKGQKGQKTAKSKKWIRAKKRRPPELRTSANQDRSLPPTLGGLLPN